MSRAKRDDSDEPTDGRAVRGEATRDRVLAAARDVLLERGFAQTSTRAVAERAGVRLSLVHYHFGSKHQLLIDVLERENDLLLERQRKLYATPGPLAAATCRSSCRMTPAQSALTSGLPA